ANEDGRCQKRDDRRGDDAPLQITWTADRIAGGLYERSESVPDKAVVPSEIQLPLRFQREDPAGEIVDKPDVGSRERHCNKNRFSIQPGNVAVMEEDEQCRHE